MRNPPPINSRPLSILLRPRPLNRQVRIAHQSLPNVIEAMIHMILLRPQKILIRVAGGVVIHPCFQSEEERAHMVETVQLMED